MSQCTAQESGRCKIEKKARTKEIEKESQVPKNRTRNPRSLVNINVDPLP